MNQNVSGTGTQHEDLPRQLDELRGELSEAHARLAEAEETLRAIHQGEVDALVISGPDGDRVFTLEGAETPYRWLVEEMNEGALLVSTDGTVLFANARFAGLAGVNLEQVMGSSWDRFFSAPDRRALTGAGGGGGIKAECTLQMAGGSTRPVEVSLVRMQRQTLDGYSVVVTDLTDRKAAEEALRASNTRLSEMVAELEHFSYSISHDMRAPLRAMKTFAVLLEENCATCDQEQNRELLGRISAAATRLDRLIEGSLVYARTVKTDLAIEPVPLDKLIHAISVIYPNLSSARVDFAVQDQMPLVLANEAALTQVFSNLLGNAVKFVAPGVKPRIRVWTQNLDSQGGEPPMVRVWVEDNGIGIPESAQSRVFGLFQRATKDYEGTGIGLAIVRKMVERMGGRVGVESEEGKGSRFWVELQRSDQELDPRNT
jgi:PAS domain S-box-containing protein